MACIYKCLIFLGFFILCSGSPYRVDSSSSKKEESRENTYNLRQNKKKYTTPNEKTPPISFANMELFEGAERLNEALSADPVDEVTVTDIILNWKDRKTLETFYNDYHDSNLNDELEGKLKGPFMRAVVSLLKGPRELDAYWVNQAIKASPLNKDTLIGIFAALNNEDLADVNTQYDQEYRPKLLAEIKRNLKEDFKKLMFTLAYSYRQFEGWVDVGLTKKDAMDMAGLLSSAPPKVIFTNVFSTRSFETLRATFEEFENRTNVPIQTFIAEKFTGDFQKTLLAIASRATDKIGYFTNLLHSALSSTINDQIITWILNSQSKAVLREMGERYVKEYGSTMEQIIRQKTDGSYTRILLKLLK